jgi:hypothetical protein
MSDAKRPFDTNTLSMLQSIFAEACNSLPPDACISKIRSDLAVRLLRRALEDKSDPAQLRAYALAEAASLSTKAPRKR